MGGAERPEPADLVGRQLGEFVVREPLGSGGFATVYRAEQPALDREAVIKVLHAGRMSSEIGIKRFLREARLASRLDHPYAAHTYAFGAEPDGLLWIAMELVRGSSLDRVLADTGPISLDRFVALVERICEVVHNAHEQGIVHRDIKPGNVMVIERSGRLLPKLLDFGIAKLAVAELGAQPLADAMATADQTHLPMAETMGGADSEAPGDHAGSASFSGSQTIEDEPIGRLTEAGRTVGSPLYMAPEQWAEGGTVTARTDIYALGVLCYEALRGQSPFTASNLIDLAIAHTTAPVPSLGEGFPKALDQVLARAMAKHPADRFRSALEFARAFRDASGIVPAAAAMPRLDESIRNGALTSLPRPVALAVDALDAARNPHQARDAAWQLVRTVAQTLASLGLAAHGHVAMADSVSTELDEALRRLRVRHPPGADWLAAARQLVAPFADVHQAHPIPELVALLARPRSALDELLELEGDASSAPSASQDQVLGTLERALPLLARLLEEIGFLRHYRVGVAAPDRMVEDWTGVRRDRPRFVAGGSAQLDLGRPVLVNESGEVLVVLWPYVQAHPPLPGTEPALFMFDGKGRSGARLVALPDSFEHEDEDLWDAFGFMLSETTDAATPMVQAEECPYPGLAAFTGADADRFFGRERESETFGNRLRVQPLLTVVGPSGAGKSSFVQAGVLPAMPESWHSVIVRPGPAPLSALASRLASLDLDASVIQAVQRGDGETVGAALRAWANGRNAVLVVVVDQLEELFTLCDDDDERARYSRVLAQLGRSVDDPVRLVLTVRDDFLIRVESLPALSARLGPGLQLVTTPAESALRRILTEPLRRAGYEFDDPALPDRMIAEVVGTPGALALLSFTASRLWQLRDRRFRQITARAYESLGGVGGALAQHAETTLEGMHPEQKRLVREVFRHAVTAQGTRAVLSRVELIELLGSDVHAGQVIEKLVTARLLVVAEDEGGGERIEITHEALLDAWPRLVKWRREDAEGARLRDQLRTAARQWDDRGRATGLLWRGDALAEYRLWRPRYPGALTSLEQAFADASLAEAARSRRLQRAGLAAIVLALAAVAIVLLVQNARVERQRQRALELQQAEQQNAQRLRALLLEQVQEQGRRLLLGEDPALALAYLHKASKMGASGPAHEFLLAQAIRATDGQLLELSQEGMVSSVEFSPDGRLLATAGQRGQMWDADTGVSLAELFERGPVHVVEWSPTGNVLATGTAQGAIVWSADGKVLHELEHPSPVRSLAFLPGGKRLVTSTDTRQVTLWKVDDGAKIAMLHAGGDAVFNPVNATVTTSRNGLIAGADETGKVYLWDGNTGRVQRSWHAHDGPVVWLAFSPDGRKLLSSTAEPTAWVWDVANGKRLYSLEHFGRFHYASFSPDGSRIVSTAADRTAVVWDARDGEELFTLAGHAAAVWAAAWSSDGKQIATAGDDGRAILWDAETGRIAARRVSHRGGLRDVSFDVTGRRMATASLDGRAIVWTTEPQHRITRLLGHSNSVWSAEFSPSGSHVLTASADQTARVWDAATGRELLVLDHPTPLVWGRFDPSGEHIATAGEDGMVRVWDARSGEPLATLSGHEGVVVDIGWDPAGERLVSAGRDGVARVWSIASGQILHVLDGHDGRPLGGAVFHPTRDVVLTTGEDHVSRLWDASRGAELSATQAEDMRYGSDFDSAGQRVVSPTTNRVAQIWNPDTGQVKHSLTGHLGTLFQASWSPDGEFVITASVDGTARLWNSRKGEMIGVLDVPDAWVTAAAFSSDGRQVILGRGDGIAELWALPILEVHGAELEELVRCRIPYETEGDAVVPRGQTPDDCRKRAHR